MSHLSGFHLFYDDKNAKKLQKGDNSVKKMFFFREKTIFVFLIAISPKDFYDEFVWGW